jgi:ribonuclease P protein component
VISGRAARETFSRGDRLRKRTEFEECYSGGVRVSGRHFLVFLRRRPEASGPPRLGVSVGKRVGDAVTRNRVKRRLREIFRRDRPSEAFDLVVHARASAATAPFDELARELADLLRRARSRSRSGPPPSPGPPAPSSKTRP